MEFKDFIHNPLKRAGCVFVVGAVHSGKSEFAKHLAAATGWEIGETYSVIAENMAASLMILAETGIVPRRHYEEWEHIIDVNKNVWRTSLVAEANKMTSIRGDSLIDPLINRGKRIIVGVRRHVEVEARLKRGCADVWVKIERPDWISPADSYELEQIEKHCTDPVLVVENRGVDTLALKACDLAKALLLKGWR